MCVTIRDKEENMVEYCVFDDNIRLFCKKNVYLREQRP